MRRIIWSCIIFAITGFCLAYDAEVRVIICSRAIADSFKKNLDAGIDNEAFGKTYSRLKESKELDELFRFETKNKPNGEKTVFQSGDPNVPRSSENWRIQIDVEVKFVDSLADVFWILDAVPPEKGNSETPFLLTGSLSMTPTANTWNVIDEFSFGEKTVLSLLHVTDGQKNKPDEPLRRQTIEGFIVPVSALDAAAFLKHRPKNWKRSQTVP